MAVTLHWVIFHGFIVIFVIEIVAGISDVPEKTIGKNETQNERAYWSRDLLRYPHATVKTYRDLQILLRMGDDVGYATLLMSQWTVYTFIVESLCLCIRTKNLELKIFALNGAINNLLLFFLECVHLEKVYKNSRGFLDSWLLRDCAQLGVKVKRGSPRERRGRNALGPIVTDTETDVIQVMENQDPRPGGEIKISKLGKKWMEKSHKSFRLMKINLGIFFADDTNYIFSGLLYIVGTVIELLVTF